MTLFQFLMSRIGQPVAELAPKTETDGFHILHEGNIKDDQIRRWVVEYYKKYQKQSVKFDRNLFGAVRVRNKPHIIKLDNIPNPGELKVTFIAADQP